MREKQLPAAVGWEYIRKFTQAHVGRGYILAGHHRPLSGKTKRSMDATARRGYIPALRFACKAVPCCFVPIFLIIWALQKNVLRRPFFVLFLRLKPLGNRRIIGKKIDRKEQNL